MGGREKGGRESSLSSDFLNKVPYNRVNWLHLANCYVTIATIHVGSTLEIIFFSQGLKCCFSFLGWSGGGGGERCGRYTRILYLREELVFFCFKYCHRERRCGCSPSVRASKTQNNCTLPNQKKKSLDSYCCALFIFIIAAHLFTFNLLHSEVTDLKEWSARLCSFYWLTVFH